MILFSIVMIIDNQAIYLGGIVLLYRENMAMPIHLYFKVCKFISLLILVSPCNSKVTVNSCPSIFVDVQSNCEM